MSVTPIDLAGFRSVLATAQRVSKDNGNTLDLSDQRISELPTEILDLIKVEVNR